MKRKPAIDLVCVERPYGVNQEYITPYIWSRTGRYRVFFTLKEECSWHHRHARRDE